MSNTDKFVSLTGLSRVLNSIKQMFNTKQDKLTSGMNIKTINGNTVLGSGNIDVVGKIDIVDTEDIVDNVNVSYATTAYVDGLVGDINSVLESIIGGGTTVRMIKFIIGDVEYQAEEGMTWEQWINSEYNTSFELYSVDPNYIVRVGSSQFVYDNFNNRNIAISDIIRANYEYTLKGMSIDPISL